MKKICKTDKRQLGRHCEEIMSKEKSPRYLCRKCARVANEKSHLCEPVKIKGGKAKK